MDPKKPQGTGDHPATLTARTERPILDGESDKAARADVFEDDDTFLEGRLPQRRATEALSVLDAQDVEHSQGVTGSHEIDGAALLEFGEGAVVAEIPGHITEVLEGPKSRGSREPSGSGRAIPVDVERWSDGRQPPPTTRAGGSAESLATVDVDAAHRAIDEALAKVRAALAELERFDPGESGAAVDVQAALENLLTAQGKLGV